MLLSPRYPVHRNFFMTSNTATWPKSPWISQYGTMTSANLMITSVSTPVLRIAPSSGFPQRGCLTGMGETMITPPHLPAVL